MQLRVTIDDKAAITLIKAVAQRADKAAPFFRVAANRIYNDVALNFRQGGVYPERWKRSKRAAGMKRGKTLQKTRALRNSFTRRSDNTSATVGTSCPYAAIHETGGTIPARTIRARNAKSLRFFIAGRAVFAKSAKLPAVTMPRRPMLPVRGGRLRPETVTFLARRAARHLGVI